MTIHQIGTPIPDFVVANYEDSCLKKINDSILKFTCNTPEPDYLMIAIDFKAKPKWVTRVWIDPEIKFRELIVDYTKKKVAIKNPNEWDLITEAAVNLDYEGKFIEELALIVPYIEKHPDSFLSLYFFTHSHAIYIENQTKKLELFNKLSPSLNKYPDYIQTKASFTTIIK